MKAMLIVALVVAVGACGRDDGDIDELIGARCEVNGDCDDRCFTDVDDYPGGFCSLQCDSDSDCTPDSFCIDKDGGVCLFLCPDFDCGRLGAGWECKDRDRVGGGKISVCFGR